MVSPAAAACHLRGRWLAKKRWNYWAVTTKDHLFSVTISNIDYIGMVFLYFGDFKAKRITEKTIITRSVPGLHAAAGERIGLRFAVGRQRSISSRSTRESGLRSAYRISRVYR